jgi:hypothetical protein
MFGCVLLSVVRAAALVDEWGQTFNSGRVADLVRFRTPDVWIVPLGPSTFSASGWRSAAEKLKPDSPAAAL